MKTILRWILAGAIAGSPLLAGQEPQTQEPHPQEEKPKPKEKPKQEPAPPSQEPKPEQKQQKEKEKEKEKEEHPKQGKQMQAPSAQGNHVRGQKIPDPKFRASFGKEHRFHVERSAADSRRFQYGGYWFEVVEVWPAGWSFDDQCYIEEDGDDYYIVDYIRPELRVLVIATG